MNDLKHTNKSSLIRRSKIFFEREIWEMSLSGMSAWKTFFVSAIKVVVTTLSGIVNKRILVQASSLSYATLLAIGPILAITILFSGIFFKDKGEGFIYGKIIDAATFVIPAFNEMAPQDAMTEGEKGRRLNPRVFEFINNISKGSSSAGTLGVATMILTCLLLCINMESALNYMWEVRKGRKWIDRIVFYFAMIFFGAVGTIFCTTFLATSRLYGFLKDIPVLSNYLTDYVSWIAFIIGFSLLIVMLACFYKFFPCARVRWRPAFIGAVVVSLLLILNNKMSFLYISYIVKQQNFYGYLAIVAVAMFSLYVFWVMILSGGMIAYAVQYVDVLSDEDAWRKMGYRAKGMAALAVFSRVCASFGKSALSNPDAPTLETLSSALHLPRKVVSECADWLVSKNLVCRAEVLNSSEFCFKPAVSPEKVTLSLFFESMSSQKGDDLIMDLLARSDPAAACAEAALAEFSKTDLMKKNLAEILS